MIKHTYIFFNIYLIKWLTTRQEIATLTEYLNILSSSVLVFKVNNTMYMHIFYTFVQLYDRSKFATEKKVNLKFNSCIDFIIRSIVIWPIIIVKKPLKELYMSWCKIYFPPIYLIYFTLTGSMWRQKWRYFYSFN